MTRSVAKAQSSSNSNIQSPSRSHAASHSGDVERNPNTLVMIVTRQGSVGRRKNTVDCEHRVVDR